MHLFLMIRTGERWGENECSGTVRNLDSINALFSVVYIGGEGGIRGRSGVLGPDVDELQADPPSAHFPDARAATTRRSLKSNRRTASHERGRDDSEPHQSSNRPDINFHTFHPRDIRSVVEEYVVASSTISNS